MHPAESLSIMDLSVKTAALVFILSLSRSSSVAAIGPSFQLVEDTVILPLVSLEKTSRPSNIRGELRCPAAVDDPELSLSTYLAAYLDRTEPCRQYFAKAEGAPPDHLFVSTTKPHQPVLPADPPVTSPPTGDRHEMRYEIQPALRMPLPPAAPLAANSTTCQDPHKSP